jgi:hypothetical protein
VVGGAVAQAKRAVMAVATIEPDENRRTSVVDERGQPFRTQFVRIGHHPLIGLMHTTHQLQRALSQRRIAIHAEYGNVTGTPGLVAVSEHSQWAATIDHPHHDRDRSQRMPGERIGSDRP